MFSSFLDRMNDFQFEVIKPDRIHEEDQSDDRARLNLSQTESAAQVPAPLENLASSYNPEGGHNVRGPGNLAMHLADGQRMLRLSDDERKIQTASRPKLRSRVEAARQRLTDNNFEGLEPHLQQRRDVRNSLSNFSERVKSEGIQLPERGYLSRANLDKRLGMLTDDHFALLQAWHEDAPESTFDFKKPDNSHPYWHSTEGLDHFLSMYINDGMAGSNPNPTLNANPRTDAAFRAFNGINTRLVLSEMDESSPFGDDIVYSDDHIERHGEPDEDQEKYEVLWSARQNMDRALAAGIKGKSPEEMFQFLGSKFPDSIDGPIHFLMKFADRNGLSIEEVLNDDHLMDFMQYHNRATAMDVMNTWKQRVLPNLEEDTLLMNTPVGGHMGARDKIYQRMGFGKVFDEEGPSTHAGNQGYQTARVKDGSLIPLQYNDFEDFTPPEMDWRDLHDDHAEDFMDAMQDVYRRDEEMHYPSVMGEPDFTDHPVMRWFNNQPWNGLDMDEYRTQLNRRHRGRDYDMTEVSNHPTVSDSIDRVRQHDIEEFQRESSENIEGSRLREALTDGRTPFNYSQELNDMINLQDPSMLWMHEMFGDDIDMTGDNLLHEFILSSHEDYPNNRSESWNPRVDGSYDEMKERERLNNIDREGFFSRMQQLDDDEMRQGLSEEASDALRLRAEQVQRLWNEDQFEGQPQGRDAFWIQKFIDNIQKYEEEAHLDTKREDFESPYEDWSYEQASTPGGLMPRDEDGYLIKKMSGKMTNTYRSWMEDLLDEHWDDKLDGQYPDEIKWRNQL